MPTVSFSRMRSIPCPKCGNVSEREVWTIVDILKDPHLLNRILMGMINSFLCEECGFVGGVDAPLLIYRPGNNLNVIYSRATKTNDEQEDVNLENAIKILFYRLGFNELSDLEGLVENLKFVERDNLPEFLRNSQL